MKIHACKLIDTQLNISGYFHAQGEDEEKNLVYRITDDKLCNRIRKYINLIYVLMRDTIILN
ncbi:hypothetical protein RIVM261_016570 [Rivularia sp. IAM M-261]|nr:hypothetical protein RIVM261_016570 [Rivularia sp. IAM M-261]